MRRFFYPRSVAVFGVSPSSSNMGRIIVENLYRFEFEGGVFPMGRGGSLPGGQRIFAGLDELPEVPELAVVLVPAVHVPETLDACGRRGVKTVIIETGGFSEFADERALLESEIKDIAANRDMEVIGPNCFGVLNLETGLVLPFFIIEPAYMKAGHVSLISQSGGIVYYTCMLCSAENVGLNKVVSIGNKLLVDENDILRYLIDDPGTHVIGLYLENFSNGRRLMELAAGTAKPIILLKANRTPSGRKIAHFHTTALAGDDAVADAAMRQAGIHRVENFREMIDAFKVFGLPSLKGPRMALISRSGGHGVLSADSAHRHGFRLADLSQDFFETVAAKKLGVIRATNPVDVGDVYDLDSYCHILDSALDEPDADGVVFIVTFSSESDAAKVQGLIRHTEQIVPKYDKPVVLCVISNRDHWFPIKLAADYPVFIDVDDGLKALAMCLVQSRKKTKPASGKGRADDTGAIPLGQPKGEARMLHPDIAFRSLETYGIPVAQFEVVKDREAALAAAARIGYPVALKVAWPPVLHKTEEQALALDLKDPSALENALADMKADEYLVQKMVPPGKEVIMGARHDSEFGHVILLGLGGVFAEVLKDVSLRIAPVDDDDAEEMLHEIKGSAILQGFRGKTAVDRDALRKALLSLSRLLMDHPEIKQIDVNPLIVAEAGGGCTAVDVKIEWGWNHTPEPELSAPMDQEPGPA